jgi:hypothetical protein
MTAHATFVVYLSIIILTVPGARMNATPLWFGPKQPPSVKLCAMRIGTLLFAPNSATAMGQIATLSACTTTINAWGMMPGSYTDATFLKRVEMTAQ